MFIAGIHEEDTDMRAATFTLGEWKVGYHYPALPTDTTTIMEEPALLNIPTTDATEANLTRAMEEEQQ
jgi:hypothetical protein